MLPFPIATPRPTPAPTPEQRERVGEAARRLVELREIGHPARQIIDDYKTRKRDRLVGLFRDAGYAEPDQLADEEADIRRLPDGSWVIDGATSLADVEALTACVDHVVEKMA